MNSGTPSISFVFFSFRYRPIAATSGVHPSKVPSHCDHTKQLCQLWHPKQKLQRKQVVGPHLDLNIFQHSPISLIRPHPPANLQSVYPMLRTGKVQRVLYRVQACWEMDVRLGALRGVVNVGDGILAPTIEDPAEVG